MKPNYLYPFTDTECSFRVFHKMQNNESPPIHYHPNYEMNFVIDGNGRRFVGNNAANFEAGDLILLAPNIPHRWENKQNSQKAYSSLVIQWREDFLGNAWQAIPEFKSIHKLLNLSSHGIQFNRYLAKEIKRHQSDLLVLPPFQKLILFLQLLNDLAKTSEFELLCDKQLSIENDIPNRRIKEILHFINNNYGEKITLSRMASLVSMSEGAFSRFFSQSMKKPFFSFLNEYRIEQACTLLKKSDLQVKEIAYDCGYDCLQFFYRQFKRYANCSPQEYRKNAISSNSTY